MDEPAELLQKAVSVCNGQEEHQRGTYAAEVALPAAAVPDPDPVTPRMLLTSVAASVATETAPLVTKKRVRGEGSRASAEGLTDRRNGLGARGDDSANRGGSAGDDREDRDGTASSCVQS